jgi:hypothetical protein
MFNMWIALSAQPSLFSFEDMLRWAGIGQSQQSQSAPITAFTAAIMLSSAIIWRAVAISPA